MRKILIAVLSLCFFVGCSQTSGTTGPVQNWDTISMNLETVSLIAATTAFKNQNISKYKDTICQTACNLEIVLANYNNPDLSLSMVQDLVKKEAAKIADAQVREVVTAVLQTVVQNTFDYAWQHYQNLVQNNEVKIATTIGKAITSGVTRACNAG